MSKALACFLLLASYAAVQTVDGTIVNSATSTGIPDVSVFLRLPAGGKVYSATTDPTGRFVFKDLEPGTYAFEYTSRDYFPSEVAPSPLVQIPNPDPVKLEGRMSPRPRVSGRVIDDSGKAIANARVELIPPGAASTVTDRAGNFELLLAERGAYILSMVPPSDLKPPDPEPGSDEVRVWTRSLYPGVSRLDAASRIPVSGTVPGIEMKLLAVKAHAVLGVLLKPDETPATNVAVTLDDGQRPKWQVTDVLRAKSNDAGVFEFPEVVDGEWRLAAETKAGATTLRAVEWIEMTGHELKDVKLHFAAPFTVGGHVVMETTAGTQGTDAFSVFLVAQGRSIATDIGRTNWKLWPSSYFEPAIPRDVPGAHEVHDAFVEITTNEMHELGAVSAKPGTGESFRLDDVYPGTYRVVALPPPPPYYLAGIRLGDVDLASPEVELSPGMAPLTVVYKTDGGSVRGTVEKCGSGIVLLIPHDPALQVVGFFRSARCDANDRYEFTAVRPGDYDVLAFSGKSGVPPALDDTVLSQASRVAVHANENASVDLRAMARPGS